MYILFLHLLILINQMEIQFFYLYHLFMVLNYMVNIYLHMLIYYNNNPI